MRQTSSLWNPLLSLWAPVFAGCCEALLAGGPSRRYLRKSFPRCLVPYPGASPGAPTRYFPGDLGLHQLGNGSATRTHAVRRLLYGGPSRGCRHSLMFRPLGLLATQVAPTAGPHRDSGQPWLLRPSIARFVTLPCLGYASRPNRAIDGVGTHTPLDLRPCRPLPQAVTWDYAPARLDRIRQWEQRGAKKGDAVITAHLEGAAIRYLVSENRDFLQELPALPFTVLSSEEAVRLLEESGS